MGAVTAGGRWARMDVDGTGRGLAAWIALSLAWQVSENRGGGGECGRERSGESPATEGQPAWTRSQSFVGLCFGGGCVVSVAEAVLHCSGGKGREVDRDARCRGIEGRERGLLGVVRWEVGRADGVSAVARRGMRAR